MQLEITGHHIDVTDALRDHIKSKLEKIKRHFDQVMRVHVILDSERAFKIAEATVHVAGHDFFAKDEKDDMYAAIDGMVDKLDRQIVKHKEKIRGHNKKSGGVKGMEAEEASA
ncbi:putative sigma-54 modulation protein [Sulfurivirga caldicuralii]|uniref:Ribosome hibernation promoting factor n=1 Tax=Sulfurivirga caldicuralii TaxID=364032 RepID=A0A1N6G499_9GAMM|nr:ribosome-associated translation inhibitor RaiA [Sulfurivirga caldicuralii]SIO02320.1 putative sigma-54 modulation protein [Sulfurivirga caldicuralii]